MQELWQAGVTMLAGSEVLAQPPDFGGGQAPPGSEKLLIIGRWVTWICAAVSVIGVMIVGAMMAVSFRHGEMGEHGKRLGVALIGIVVFGASTGIVNALM
ncbi:conjugal transfer protein TrbC [Actinopolyspora halophila]|uniref:conjugal transfer protein TrbC n=1 Tax=Actinopolyspora halophila TaxID=1850 RepID=UPI00039FC195|nr:conjugal transfer protein TrbC [Actinopolyspora halophila]